MAPTCLAARAARAATVATTAAVAFTAFVGVPASADERHRVGDGETVSGLATRYDSTVRDIVAANGLNSRATIIVGQTLTIPTSSSAPASSSAGTHRVVAGDTVWSLARSHGTTVSAIISANGLDARAIIREGQQLTIPGSGTSQASSQPAAKKDSGAGSHTVTSGDTVWDLARRYGTSVSSILSANGLDSRAVIRTGQTLAIPGATAVGDAPASAPASAPATSSAAQTQTYIVTSGDTVARIASKFGTSINAIVTANSIKNPSMIRVGQQLTVPGASSSTAAPANLVGNTFLGRTYSAPVVSAANQNKAALNAKDVPSRDQMQQMIIDTANRMGVDPALAQAVAYQESGFNMRAVSPANAVGVMQVIPSAGNWASGLVGRDLNLLDPQDNVTAGVAILRQLQRDGRALETAIAGYYQGETGVRKYGMYADTKRYVASVLALRARFS